MHCVRKISEDMYYVGGNDRKTAMFENHYPIDGISYNSYLIMDEKTVLIDCVDTAIHDLFFDNLSYVLGERQLDYVIVNHMEPDHCGVMASLVLRYPEVKIVGNAKTMAMIKQFFDFEVDSRSVLIGEGDEFSSGRHTFKFYMAPMVHWPEAMATYDGTDKTLYSADAFGTFGALDGNIFADEMNFENTKLCEARRYYANIVGKYGPSVTALLDKISKLSIKLLCPLHGPVWRDKSIAWYVGKYRLWSSYIPEDDGVMIAVGSIYGHTANAADILAAKLSGLGVKNIKIYDVSKTHSSYIVAEAFRCSHLVFACATYNFSIFSNMETLLTELKAHNLQNRTVGIIENGTWAPASGRLMTEIFAQMKNIAMLEQTVNIKSAVKAQQSKQLDDLARALAGSILK